VLYPSRTDVPDHVPPELIIDYDTFHVDVPDGDFAAAMVRLRDTGVPDLFWTQRNGGHWVATKSEHVRRIIEDAENFSSRAMRVPKQANPAAPIIPLMIDPPDHAHYRRLLSRAMTPGAVKLLADRARALSIGLIEELEPKEQCEFVADFAQQMPIAIFMGMLDLPARDRPVIIDIVDRIIRPDVPETRIRGFADLAAYTMAKVRERRAALGSDLVSDLKFPARWRRLVCGRFRPAENSARDLRRGRALLHGFEPGAGRDPHIPGRMAGAHSRLRHRRGRKAGSQSGRCGDDTLPAAGLDAPAGPSFHFVRRQSGRHGGGTTGCGGELAAGQRWAHRNMKFNRAEKRHA
jgi:hypothetical protein